MRLLFIPRLRLTNPPAAQTLVAVLGVLPGSPSPVVLGSSGIPALKSEIPASLLLASCPACISAPVPGVALIPRPVPGTVPVPIPVPGPVCAPPANCQEDKPPGTNNQLKSVLHKRHHTAWKSCTVHAVVDALLLGLYRVQEAYNNAIWANAAFDCKCMIAGLTERNQCIPCYVHNTKAIRIHSCPGNQDGHTCL